MSYSVVPKILFGYNIYYYTYFRTWQIFAELFLLDLNKPQNNSLLSEVISFNKFAL